MREGKASESWDHTAVVVATLANLHRDRKKSRPITIEKVHPYFTRTKQNKAGTALPLSSMKSYFKSKKK